MALSLLLFAAVAVCYLLRPDIAAAVTVFPLWAWLLPGWALAGLGWAPRRSRPALLVIGLWFMWVLIFADEPISVLRAMLPWPTAAWQQAHAQGTALRFITYNALAMGDDIEGIRYLAAYQPDLILMQETPDVDALRRQVRKWLGPGYQLAIGWDTAIIVKGEILEHDPGIVPRQLDFKRMRVRFAGGREAEVLCLHLISTNTRVDLWNPDLWRLRAHTRQKQRDQLADILQKSGSLQADVPIIVGGDFNAPSGDAIFRLLRPKLHDAGQQGNRGWPDTLFVDLPILRVDQFWLSRHFRAAAVYTCATPISDHHMVIADVFLQ